MRNSVVIYAAGPIDLGKDIPNWRADLMLELHSLSQPAVLFDPSTAFKTSQWGVLDLGRSLFIERVNRFALDSSCAFVALIPKKVPSVGTPIESDFAAHSGGVAHQYIISDIEPGKSVYLDNRFSVDDWFITNLEDPAAIKATLKNLASKIFYDINPSTLRNKFSDD